MKDDAPKLPESLWGQVPRMFDNSVWDLKLSDGSVHLEMFISDDGSVRGKVVGGHDGIIPPPEGIKGNNVVAIRKSARLLGISLGKWMKPRDVQQENA